MTPDAQQPETFTFGYFPRHKYKDLVFYVENKGGMNDALFEMPDTEHTRKLMDALLSSSRSPHIPAPDIKSIWLKLFEKSDLDEQHIGYIKTSDVLEICKSFSGYSINQIVDIDNWVRKDRAETARTATLAAYNKFLDEVRTEEYDNCGYVDMDSVEAAYNRLRQQAGDQ